MKVKNKNTLFISLLFFLITIVFFVGFILKDPYRDFKNEQKFKTLNINNDVNLVFYKKACPYCKAGKSEIVKNIKSSKVNSYVINVDTKDGEDLAHKYNVQYAPTIVSIRGSKVSSFLYADDEDGKIVVRKNKIKEAFKN